MPKKAIYGKKVGMTQIFLKEELIPVTVIKVYNCVVVQKKNVNTDGYVSVQVGFVVKEKDVNKPTRGHFDKAGVGFKRFLREIKLDDCDKYNVGDELSISQFEVGEYVDVTGTSKGKGFAGAIKRHGYQRGPMSHGSGYHRWAGSMGANSKPARVFKGKKLPGHMGVDKVTVQNIVIAFIDSDENLIILKGCVSGPKNGIVFIKNAVKVNS